MKKIFLLWFMQTSLYKKIVLKGMPFIRFSTLETSFRGDKYHSGYSQLKPGMIVCSIDTHKLTGLLIPKVTGGVLSHAALCVGKRDQENPIKDFQEISPIPGHGQGLEIVEMTHLDFTFSDFFDMCHESERIIILDCEAWDDEYKKKVIKAALEFRSSLYDPEFSMDTVGFLYCSELLLQADKKAGNGTPRLKVNMEDLMGLGKPYLSPDGLLCAENIKVVWDSSQEFTGMTGTQTMKKIFGKDSNVSNLS